MALLWAPILLGAVPKTIGLEGRLQGQGGGPVADGEYSLTFALYPDAKAQQASWSEVAKVTVTAGHFVHILGSTKVLASTDIDSDKSAWIGIAVDQDPEMPRSPLSAVAYAMRAAVAETATTAQGLSCSGCVSGAALSFPYAASLTKGGPAADLACTACVGIDELKFDTDVDLGAFAIKAKSAVFSGDVSAKTVMASSFVGDGSKLTGLTLPNGDCVKGQVVVGVAADGSLKCQEMQANLPPDGLAQVSSGLLTNVFDHKFKIDKPVPIPDGSLNGVSSTVNVPDVGIVKSLNVHLKLSNSDIAGIRVTLTPPDGKTLVLYDKGKTGKDLEGNWPSADKVLLGSLDGWVGKNAVGTWELSVYDLAPAGTGQDGSLIAFEVGITALSNSKVELAGSLSITGELMLSGEINRPLKVCEVNGGKCIGRYVGSSAINGSTTVGDVAFYYVPMTLPLDGGYVTGVAMFSGCTGNSAKVAQPNGETYYDKKGCSGTAWRENGATPYSESARTVCTDYPYKGTRCSLKNASGCHDLDCYSVPGNVRRINYTGTGKQMYELR
ncbi:MAG: proprotein convertase P-domain-containing protein [Deltaproteobacteria bacterium]|nr:proprotein convertase P-domain-containing protein [Deltaproteobacteria bacterium]